MVAITTMWRKYREKHKECLLLHRDITILEDQAIKLVKEIHSGDIQPTTDDISIQIDPWKQWYVIKYQDKFVLDAKINEKSTDIKEFVPGPWLVLFEVKKGRGIGL